MSPGIILLILLAALLHATWNAIVKSGTDKLHETALNAFGGGIGMFLLLPFLPLPASASLPLLAGSCCIHLAYYVCMAVAYRNIDMSFAYTIMRGTAPLMTSLALFAAGDKLSMSGWLGILCLCSGVLVLTRDSFQQHHFNLRGTLAALGTAFIIMGYTLFDGYGARASGHPVSYVVWLYAINCLPLNIMLLLKNYSKYTAYFKLRWKTGLFGGLCSLGSYGAALWAMTRAPIAMVAALRETSVIFGMLLAVIFLGERLSLNKILAVSLVVAGTMIMRLG